MDELPEVFAPKLRRSIRIGVSRREVFRPFCNLGVVSDGGVWLSPVQLRDYAWTYGVTGVFGVMTRPIEVVTVSDRPKLHYHRSGHVYVTLSGREIPRRSLRLPPVPGVHEAQIMSVVAQRPWEFVAAEQRKGDICLLARHWPTSVGLTLSLVHTRKSGVQAHDLMSPLAPVGLTADDDSTFFVDLGASVPHTALVVRAHVHEEPEPEVLEPSVTVAALPWDSEKQKSARGVLALWSAPLAHPLIAQASAEHLVPSTALATAASGEILLATLDEHADRIFGRRSTGAKSPD